MPDKMDAGLVDQVWKVTFAIFSVINFWYQHWKSTLKRRVGGLGAQTLQILDTILVNYTFAIIL